MDQKVPDTYCYLHVRRTVATGQTRRRILSLLSWQTEKREEGIFGAVAKMDECQQMDLKKDGFINILILPDLYFLCSTFLFSFFF